MIQALENFVGEPLRHRRFDLAWYRISQLLHDRTNGGYDALYMRLARIFRPKVSLPELPQAQRDEIKDVVDRLRRDGYMILPELLPAQDVEEIKNFAFSTPGFGNDLNKSVPISADNIPEGQARYYWWMDELARVPGDTTFNRRTALIARSRRNTLVAGQFSLTSPCFWIVRLPGSMRPMRITTIMKGRASSSFSSS